MTPNKTPPIIKEFRKGCQKCSQNLLNREFRGDGLLIHDKDNIVYLDEKAIEQFLLKALKEAYEQGKKDAKNA